MINLLKQLGYSQYWLELGIIDESILRKLIVLLEEDSNSEHHRYNILVKYINSKKYYSDKEVEKLILLLNNDSDQLMTSGIYVFLLSNGILSERQFDLVATEFIKLGSWAIEKIALINLEQKLKTQKISNEEIKNIIMNKNVKEHYLILEYCTNNDSIVELLSRESPFKKIRNRALHLSKK